MHVLCRRRRCR